MRVPFNISQGVELVTYNSTGSNAYVKISVYYHPYYNGNYSDYTPKGMFWIKLLSQPIYKLTPCKGYREYHLQHPLPPRIPKTWLLTRRISTGRGVRIKCGSTLIAEEERCWDDVKYIKVEGDGPMLWRIPSWIDIIGK